MNIRHAILVALIVPVASGVPKRSRAAGESSSADPWAEQLREAIRAKEDAQSPDESDPAPQLRLDPAQAWKFERLARHIKVRLKANELEVGRLRRHRIALMDNHRIQIESEGLFLPEAAFLVESDGSLHPRVWYGRGYRSLRGRAVQARLREELSFWMDYAAIAPDPPGPPPPPPPLPRAEENDKNGATGPLGRFRDPAHEAP